jgi:hypothetical protein
MKLSRSAALRFPALAALLLLGAAAPALAQATSQPAKPKSASKPAAKPAPKATAQSDYWSVNYEVPREYETSSRTTRVEERTPLSRVPTQSGNGTIGVTTDSAIRRGQLFDGRDVPGGVSPNTQKESSFVGLSLNVKSGNNSFPIPAPPTPWDRNE